MDSRIKLLRVAPEMFDRVWPHIIDLMRRGLGVAPELVHASTRIRIAQGDLQVWIVAQEEPETILAVFLTDINKEDDGSKWIKVQALAGRQMWKWARKVHDRMVAFALAEDCQSFRFAGKRGWGRVLRECRVIGEHEAGVPIFERAVS